MPQLGETVAEGKITTWFKSIGDAVKPGDNLFEIETDKVSMEVPATSDRRSHGDPGRRRRGGAGGHRRRHRRRRGRARRESAGRCAATESDRGTCRKRAFAVAAAIAARAATPVAARRMLDPFREVRTPERNYGPAKLASGAVVTPLARRLAGQAGIDLSRIAASGPHGRIVARDVQSAIAAAPSGAVRSARRRPIASRRSTPRAPTKRCRSIPCGAPSRRGWSKPSRPSRIST